MFSLVAESKLQKQGFKECLNLPGRGREEIISTYLVGEEDVPKMKLALIALQTFQRKVFCMNAAIVLTINCKISEATNSPFESMMTRKVEINIFYVLNLVVPDVFMCTVK